MIEEYWVAAFRPVAPTHNTAQFYSPPQSTVERSYEVGTNYPGRGREYIIYVSVFLASIGCNLVVISLVDGICGQRPSCVLRCPLHFLTFPLPAVIEPTLGSAVPTPHHKPPPNCRNFLLWLSTALPSMRTVNNTQATRCHSPKHCKFPTTWLCCTDDWLCVFARNNMEYLWGIQYSSNLHCVYPWEIGYLSSDTAQCRV